MPPSRAGPFSERSLLIFHDILNHRTYLHTLPAHQNNSHDNYDNKASPLSAPSSGRKGGVAVPPVCIT